MTPNDKITSIRESIGGSYIKPSVDKLNKFIEDLYNSPPALDYLKIQRGLSEETIKYFNLGYDINKNAIAIPEYKGNELINIKYRHLAEDAKQRYSQEKGCEVWMFHDKGLEEAKQKGAILIVEGQFDCMSAWQAGFKNTISPSSGKESYGKWIEIIDTIPRVWLAYDNDKPGKATSKELASRIGEEKCYEIEYPEEIKDANDYFKKYTAQDYRVMIKKARPFYKYTYQGLGDVVDAIKTKGDKRLVLDSMPFVKMHEDWMVVVSGISGIGKTSYVMNIAEELLRKGMPALIMPFERGLKDVGARYLQIHLRKTEDALLNTSDDEWDKILPDIVELPLYFSTPPIDKMRETVEKAKRLLGVKVVIIDHLDYCIGGGKSNSNNSEEMQRVLQGWKTICLDNEIIFIVVHHIRKGDTKAVGNRKPSMEDLKGGSSSFQVPEAVIMLSSKNTGQLEIDIVKNKGELGAKVFEIHTASGRLGEDITDKVGQDIDYLPIDNSRKTKHNLDDF